MKELSLWGWGCIKTGLYFFSLSLNTLHYKLNFSARWLPPALGLEMLAAIRNSFKIQISLSAVSTGNLCPYKNLSSSWQKSKTSLPTVYWNSSQEGLIEEGGLFIPCKFCPVEMFLQISVHLI